MHLYINGMYWGLHNPVERPDASFSAAYSGGDKDAWDSLNTGVAVDGSADNWAELNRIATLVNTTDIAASNAAYQRLLGNHPDGTRDPSVEPLLNVDNLIDYMILNLYAGNTDWPGRNWYAGRQRGVDSTGFEFYAWDSEWIIDLQSSLTTDRTSVSEGVARVYSQLRSNAEFRLRFSDRVQRVFARRCPLCRSATQSSRHRSARSERARDALSSDYRRDRTVPLPNPRVGAISTFSRPTRSPIGEPNVINC